MKPITNFTFITCLLLAMAACKQAPKSNLALLSDELPTDSALVFAPGLISTGDFEFAITFSPEMDELFFTRRKWDEDNIIYHMQLKDGQWSTPEVAFFTPDQGWDFEPHINPQGDRLYFGSLRPLPDTTQRRGLHQWFSVKTESGWSEPAPLEEPFQNRFVMYISSSDKDDLYFTSSGGIHYSNYDGGQYGEPVSMGSSINDIGESTAHPFIAPDQSYMIYDSKSESGFGNYDLYISFNQGGTWTAPQNLGAEINTGQCEMCASVSPDGKYLFFHRGFYEKDVREGGNIYWADFARIREKFEPKSGE